MKKSLIAALGLSMVAFAGYGKEADQRRIYVLSLMHIYEPNIRSRIEVD